MSGTADALRLIEMASARLYQSVSGSVALIERSLSTCVDDVAPCTTPLEAVQKLVCQMDLMQSAWAPSDEPISLMQLINLAQGLPRGVLVTCSDLPAGTVFSSDFGRIALNLLMLAADSLPSGGTITLVGNAADLFVKISGPGACWPSALASCLMHEANAGITPYAERDLQLMLTVLFARAARVRLSLLLSSTAQIEPAIIRLGG